MIILIKSPQNSGTKRTSLLFSRYFQQIDLIQRTGEAVQTMAEPVCSNARVTHNILVNAVKWTDVIQITVSMVEHVLLLLLMIFQCKNAIVPSTMVVLIVTLTCVQESSVVVEHVLVEIVNVIQIMSTSKTLVNKHV